MFVFNTVQCSQTSYCLLITWKTAMEGIKLKVRYIYTISDLPNLLCLASDIKKGGLEMFIENKSDEFR